MQKNKDALVIGLALFSLFFGAGNLIFPPYLGVASGGEWLLAFVIYFIFDIGLALVAIRAIMKNDGKMSNVTNQVGKIPSKIICTVLILCIGPLFVIPRTAATAFEMFFSIKFLPEKAKALFSLVYFAIVIFLTIRPTKVIDIIGKVLTPILFVGLTFLIVYGIIHPFGTVSSTILVDNVVKEGVTNGYQTMDVFGGLVFAGIIVESVLNRGYKDKKSQNSVTVRACLIASVLLLFVYGGLTYLGATASTKFDLSVDRTQLLVAITKGLLGNVGAVALCIIVVTACLTTAIGLVSSCSDYFQEATKQKLSYKKLVLISTGVSFLIANLGLNAIITLAAPILNLTYPIVLTMICLSLNKKYHNKYVNYGSVVFAGIVSLLNLLNGFGLSIPFISKLPLYSYDLYWILPAIIGGVIGGVCGIFIENSKKSINEEKEKLNA